MSYREFAYVYDRLMADMPYADWLRFASVCWERLGIRPRTVADLGCGTGSVSIPLAESGVTVYGIDLSEDMLAIAREKSAYLPPSGPGSVLWLEQDMREWEADSLVDAVLSFCDCLNYLLDEEDIRRTFRRTFEGLNRGGVFLFDVHTPYRLRQYAASQPFMLDEEDVAYIWTCGLEEETMEIEHALTFFVRVGAGASAPLYRRFEETHVQRAYPLDWLQQELEAAGFRDVRQYADFAWEPPSEETGRVFFVAIRP